MEGYVFWNKSPLYDLLEKQTSFVFLFEIFIFYPTLGCRNFFKVAIY